LWDENKAKAQTEMKINKLRAFHKRTSGREMGKEHGAYE